MLHINPAPNAIKPSSTLAINQTVKKMQQSGQYVQHLGFGQSAFPVPQLMVKALADNAHQKAYLPGLGLPELRSAVAGYYQQEFGYDTDTTQVIIGPGSKELIFNLLYLIEGELLLPAPCWVSYAPQATLLNKPYRYIQTNASDNYNLTAEALEQACLSSHSECKLLILNSPNNPTGCLHDNDDLKALADVCRRHNVIVISDEIYAKINFNDTEHTSIAQHYPEGTFITAGLSKLFGAGGYRLGTCIVPQALSEIIAPWSALISETFSCVSSPIQYAAVTAYRDFDQIRDVLHAYSNIQQAASQAIYNCFKQCQINCPEPKGAFYLMPDFENHREFLAQQGVHTNTELANWLLQQHRIATLPGSDFGLEDSRLCLRVAAVDFDGEQAYKVYQANDGKIDADYVHNTMPNIVKACETLNAAFALNTV